MGQPGSEARFVLVSKCQRDERGRGRGASIDWRLAADSEANRNRSQLKRSGNFYFYLACNQIRIPAEYYSVLFVRLQEGSKEWEGDGICVSKLYASHLTKITKS